MTSSNGWIKRQVQLAGFLLTLLAHQSCHADNIRIGVAANFRTTLEQIAAGFEHKHKTRVDISAASTGMLFAQVKNGAPFDMLFAADKLRPALLESSGYTRLRRTYAYGELVFWTPGLPASELALKQQKGTIAIANPRHAPYGQAAIDTLNIMEVKPERLVYGNNIAQAFNFVRTGNVPAGLVAFSQIRHLKIPEREFWLVPPEFYAPIEQQLVVMQTASTEAEKFVDYVFSPETTKLIERSGYQPSSTATRNDSGRGTER